MYYEPDFTLCNISSFQASLKDPYPSQSLLDI